MPGNDLFTKDRKLKKLAILGPSSFIIFSHCSLFLKNWGEGSKTLMSLTNVHLLVSESDLNSFPSGHTSNPFALAIGMGLNWEIKIKDHSTILIWVLILIACIIGFSRVYIGVHYPSDVIVGARIGITGGLIATILGNSYLKDYVIS
ncbi:undecaprenyl-diphosphatase BcrC [Methanobrevibacter cuticularis]|uniref:Undecaprenyl-diphosphatase BcrC n=1 Tax=Methanobrevibacter cuticularis TaxID=47311 RepID=A0A166CR69_9EURY|nr:phosphatase PAP2 family protein [Methanobrevibacter cuticularis]KZX14781.1 undecaprenyl-diphosphatase BcrC [Methanobrevibacter cuticularis]